MGDTLPFYAASCIHRIHFWIFCVTGETSLEAEGQEDASGVLVTDIRRSNVRHAMYQILRLVEAVSGVSYWP